MPPPASPRIELINLLGKPLRLFGGNAAQPEDPRHGTDP
jgi:hypothetical protein